MGQHTKYKPITEANVKGKAFGVEIKHISGSKFYHVYVNGVRLETEGSVASAISSLNRFINLRRKLKV